MITISLCMIVKNEEATIQHCLNSVKDFADEIIIVDTGSNDRTKEIVAGYTDRIYDFTWIDDFAAARNYSFSLATKDYILWLDADDIFLPEEIEKMKALKGNLEPSIDSVTMKYVVSTDEFGNPSTTFRRNRLVKRVKDFKWIGFVHEYLAVNGEIYNSDISINHRKIKHTPNRNLEIYQNKLNQGIEFTTRDILYYGNELYDHQIFDKALEYYNKFLDSGFGWSEDNIRVCGNISDYYKSIHKFVDARNYAYKSFEYDIPRAEACCRIGYAFLQENKLLQAVYWYELATKLEKPNNSWGFFNDACWTWLPHLQLCLCYDRLGKHKLAFEHNEIARKFRPEDERILFNQKYFEGIKDRLN